MPADWSLRPSITCDGDPGARAISSRFETASRAFDRTVGGGCRRGHRSPARGPHRVPLVSRRCLVQVTASAVTGFWGSIAKPYSLNSTNSYLGIIPTSYLWRAWAHVGIPTMHNSSAFLAGSEENAVLVRCCATNTSMNNRRFERYELETELTANMLGGERRTTMRGRCLNINKGGIAGLFTDGWDVGTSVELCFSVPFATAPVRASGVVRNRVGYRFGFEFVDLSPEQREAIGRTCTTLGLLQ